jgi:hypothetical protein
MKTKQQSKERRQARQFKRAINSERDILAKAGGIFTPDQLAKYYPAERRRA